MAAATERFQQRQTQQVEKLKHQNMQLIAELRTQHLKELFAPCLWISAEVQPCSWQGFYTLSPEESSDLEPVYCKYNSSTLFLYPSRGEWWFSSRENMVKKAACGFVHSTRAANPAGSVLSATGWRLLRDRIWCAIEVRVEEVRAPVEFVIVSLAGEELLRKSCLLDETVGHLKKELQAMRNNHQSVQLCFQSTRLRKSTPLGCLSMRPGEPLQAIFALRKCVACSSVITGPPSRCVGCARSHCRPCSATLARCWRCGKRVCERCAGVTARWFFIGMCSRCAPGLDL